MATAPVADRGAAPEFARARFGLQLERTLRYFQGELSGEHWQEFGGDAWALASALEVALRDRQTQAPALDALLSARDFILRRRPHAIGSELLALAVQAAWSPRTAGLRPDRAAAVLDLVGEVYKRRAAPAEAEACFRAVLELADASGHPELSARARGELGSFLLGAGRIPEGLALVKSALVRGRACGSRLVQARAWLALGWHYKRLRDGRRARLCLRRALPLVKALGEPNHIGRTWLDLSTAYQQLNDFDRAARAARHALVYFKRSGDLRLQAQTWYRLGVVHFGRERYRPAALLFRRSKRVCERQGDLVQLANVYQSLGAAYWGLRDWPRAEACSRQALALARRLNLELSEIEVLINFGWIYLEQLRHAEGAAVLREARAQLDARAGRPELAGWVRLKLAEVTELEARLPAAGTADERG